MEDPLLLRNKDGHLSDLVQSNPTETGLKRQSILNDLKYFHVTENVTPDIMHDILEGVGAYEIKLVLSSLISHKQYPCLKDTQGKGYEAWFSPGRSHRPATGFLEERLRNVRKRTRRETRTSCEKDDSEAIISMSSISVIPANKVAEYMKETAIHRSQWIRANGTKSIEDITCEFPRLLDTPGMISQDFSVLFPDHAERLFLDWKVGTNMVEYLKKADLTKPFPFVLGLGDCSNCHQAFVVVGKQALQQNTLICAVDTCFKLFYVLDIHFPKQCAPVWEFLQTVVYKLPGTESPSVRLLRSYLSC
ncbi:hypothetical protein ROHU_006995 [Labeo rohita]|uniref:Uncharacterized protein n=1 Tax=Labeo rohita TaxID=84645 RepID=A0A498MVG9_LABRO|nr:hypothetical protein ROHU_006995 [Labeo rohita]